MTAVYHVSAGAVVTVESDSGGQLPYTSLPFPLTVAVYPDSGGSVTVEQRIAPGGDWKAVADGPLAGTLSADAVDVLQGPVHGLRFTAAVAAATVEIAQ